MSEEPNTHRDHLRRNSSKDMQDSKNSLEEIGDKINTGINTITKKIDKPGKDLKTEYHREKFKEDTKDY